MGGMEMMFKQMLGIDPAELKEQFQKGIETLGATLKHFDDSLNEIKRQQAETNKLLAKLLQPVPEGNENVGDIQANGSGDTDGQGSHL